jgi:membrane protease subunit HflK
MAWNEPGGNRNDQDPWGNNGGNKGGNQGPPDLDEAIKQFMAKINGLFGGDKGKNGNNGGGNAGQSGNGFVYLLVILLVGFLIFKSVFTIDEQDRGVVLTLGKYSRTLEPGLHFIIPLVEKVLTVNVTNVRNAELKQEMLTQDENVVEIELNVQYTAANPVDFALRVEDPELTLSQAAESALRTEVGSTDLNPILTDGRALLAENVKLRLQQYMNNYNTGIIVSTVNIKEARAPAAVQAAFDDVQKANLDKERYINEAESYANSIVPEARGNAQRILEDAQAYKAKVVASAKGEADRFEKLLTAYKKAPEVTRERLYLDALSTVYANSSKVLVDIKGGNNVMYLPLDKLVNSGSRAAASPSGASDQPDVSSLTDKVVHELRSRSIGSSRGNR